MTKFPIKTRILKLWREMRLRKNEFIGFTLILAVLVVWSIYSKTQYDNYKKEIFRDYEITTGYLIGYSIIGDANDRILTYKYFASGKRIKRKLTPPTTYDYDYCASNFNLCKGTKFHVIFSTNNPKKSLIDLTHEIDSIDSIYVSANLDKFE